MCMVDWMGRNFDVFSGFQQTPCYLCVKKRYTVYICTVVKSKGKILQNFVAFLECMNFMTNDVN